MSATLETKKIFNYFQRECSILEIEGRFHPIKIFNTKEPIKNFIDGCVNTVFQIHTNEPKGDILVFLTGQEEIEDLQKILQEKSELLPKNYPKLVIRPLFAALPAELQLLAFKPVPEGTRKVVISTNIAETSVTIDGIRYVVDPGFVKLRFFDSAKNIESLITLPISQSSATQRAGRAGRQAPGFAYRLYPKFSFEDLEEFLLPVNIFVSRNC